MSAVVERAIADPTANLELVSTDVENLDATRHLFLAANLLDPARQRDTGMKDGGEELGNICLRRTQGKIPKCEITPLEFWVEWMPKELVPEGLEHLTLALKDPGSSEPLKESNRIFKPLFGFPYHPGHAIVDALSMAGGERRGIVEIENLRGTDYGKEDRDLQNLFFPADYKKPVELRLIEEHILQVADSVADPDAKDTANYMLESVVQSREYMSMVVSIAQTQLAERKTFQFVHRLTPKIRSFMAQLEVKPPMAAQIQDTVDKSIVSLPPELLEQFSKQSDALANLGPAIADAVQSAITAALSANKAPAKAKPSE